MDKYGCFPNDVIVTIHRFAAYGLGGSAVSEMLAPRLSVPSAGGIVPDAAWLRARWRP